MDTIKPSRTAYKVALNIITLGTIPGMDRILPSGILEATEQLLIKSGVANEKVIAFSRSKWALKMYAAFDWMVPGQFEAFAYRKNFCENQVREGIKRGVKQVLVIGAGYDTLCWRLAPLFEDVRFFEIDHPNTMRLKCIGLEAMGMHENLFLIADDLATSGLSLVLEKNRYWNSEAQTVIIAEGLVMYLEERSVLGLFDDCMDVSGQGSRIAFSYIPMGKKGNLSAGPWTWLMMWLQKLGGEPWLWGVSPEKLSNFLKKSGWKQSFEHNEALQKYGVEYYAVGRK